jgi:four helix bundle protein
MMPYERLDAWRACHALAIATYRATGSLPDTERYGLVAQMRRAAVSAASNIAEGSAKRGARELRRYLDIALGSLAELCYQIRLSNELSYLSAKQFSELEELRSTAGKLTWGLHESARRNEARFR